MQAKDEEVKLFTSIEGILWRMGEQMETFANSSLQIFLHIKGGCRQDPVRARMGGGVSSSGVPPQHGCDAIEN